MSMHHVLHSFAYGLDYLREQVADVADDAMTRQPLGIVNHPAWVIGHLTFSCQAIGGELGMKEWLPASSATLYGMGSKPVDDVAHYGPKCVALEALGDAQDRITRAVESADDRLLDSPLPDERYREVLPTLRHALTQVLVAHTSSHVGQIAIWRRVMGLPRLARPFL